MVIVIHELGHRSWVLFNKSVGLIKIEKPTPKRDSKLRGECLTPSFVCWEKNYEANNIKK